MKYVTTCCFIATVIDLFTWQSNYEHVFHTYGDVYRSMYSSKLYQRTTYLSPYVDATLCVIRVGIASKGKPAFDFQYLRNKMFSNAIYVTKMLYMVG